MRRSIKSLVAVVATASLYAAAVSWGFVAEASAAGPAITTDQADYAPGSVVDLSGSGWSAGDAVHLTVDDSDGQSWRYVDDVVADASGAFDVQFTLPDWFVANYLATATDAAGVTATHAFTDGNVQGRVIAGSTQVAEPLQVKKYRTSSSCTGIFRTTQITTVTTGPQNLAGVGGVGNPQSAGVQAPTQIVVSNHLYVFDHWFVDTKSNDVTTTSNPVCVTGGAGTTALTAYYTDHGPTGQQQQEIVFDGINDVTFGDPDFQISPYATSGLPVSLSATGDCTVSPLTSPATVHVTGAGSCSIEATQLGNASFLAADPVTQGFLIFASSAGVVITVTCPSAVQTYTGDPIEPCTASAVVDGVTKPVSSLTYTDNVDVGTATATAAYQDKNHSLTQRSATFTIGPDIVPVQVTGSQTYGGQPTFSSSYTTPNGTTITGAVSCATVSPNTAISPTLTAGSYTLLGSSCTGLQIDTNDYAFSYTGGTFTVNRADITATVTGGHTYGDAPSFSQTNDAPNGVSVDDTLLTCTGTTSGDTISSTLPWGSYFTDPSTCSGLSSSDPTNYRIVYASGSYEVTKGELLVTVTGTQTYGGTGRSFTGTPPAPMPTGVTYAQGTLSCTKLTGNVSIDGTLGVAGSPYTIDPASCSGDSLSGANAANYDLVHAGSQFTVSRLSINVPVSGTQVYGSNPVYTASLNGLGYVNGDSASAITGTLACQPVDTTLGTGSHAITSCTGLDSLNYEVHYTLGSLVVSQKPITANISGSQVYGGAPTWSVTYPAGSFVGTDTSSVVLGTLTCLPVDTSLTVAGSPYAISGCDGLYATNYAITYNPGTLSVTPKAITIRVTGSQVYGGTPTYTLDYTNTQFANNEGPSAVNSSLLACTTSATSTSGVGTYPITGCSGVTAANYSITLDKGSVTVTQKPISVPVNGTQVYGGTGITYTPDFSGVTWVGSDGPGVVTGTLTCTTDATASSPVGTSYHVTGCTGLSATNYLVTLTNGGFSVTKAPSTTAVSCPLSVSYTGSARTPCSASVTGAGNLNLSGLTPTYSNNVNVGTATASYTYAGDTNHFGSYGSATFAITQAAATLLYTGTEYVTQGNNAVLSAALSSAVPACVANQPLTFTLTPLDGSSAPLTFYATTGSTGQGSTTAATSNMATGVYSVVVSLTSTNCLAGNAEDSLTVVGAGDTANGGGWYTLDSTSTGSGRVNFGFTVQRVPNTTDGYKGQLLLQNNGKWRLKATLDCTACFGKSSAAPPVGTITGTGKLYRWDATLNNGLGGWALVNSAASFTANFTDASQGGGKKSSDAFGIAINYTTQSGEAPLPNSKLITLKGGDVKLT